MIHKIRSHSKFPQRNYVYNSFRSITVESSGDGGGGSGPLPFPSGIPGLYLWLDAELSNKWADNGRTTPASTSGTVGAWDDLSGKGLHFIQSTSARRPTLLPAALQSMPALGFAGGQELVKAMNAGTDTTWFFVLKPDMTTDITSLFDTAPFNGNTLRCLNTALGTLPIDWHNQNPQTNISISDGFHLLSFTTKTSPSRTVVARLDGQVVGSGVGTGTTGITWADTSLGSVNGTPGYKGLLSSVIIYSGVLSTADTTSVEDYLYSRYQKNTGTSPIVKDGLYFWLKADGNLYQDVTRVSGAVANGDPVAMWDDSFIYSRNFRQTDATKRPLYRPTGINGHPAIEFDGSNDFIQGSGTFYGGSSVTMFFMLQSDVTSPVGLIDTAPNSAGTLRNNGSTSNNLAVDWHNNAPIVQVPIDTSRHVMTIIATNIPQRTVTVRIDGVAVASGTNASTTPMTWTSPVFGVINGGSSPYDGKIAEIITYDKVCTAAEINHNESYLTNKYA